MGCPGSFVLGCWVLGPWLLDGRDDWGTSTIRRNERPFVFLSGAVWRFPPSTLYEYWRHMTPWFVLFLSAFFSTSVSFASFPLPLSCVGPYSVRPCDQFGGRGRCTLPCWRWSFCIHICTRTGVQTNLTRHGWKELIHLTLLVPGTLAFHWLYLD